MRDSNQQNYEQKCRDPRTFCEQCNGFGFVSVRANSPQEIEVLAERFPKSEVEVKVYQETCTKCAGDGVDPVKGLFWKGRL